MMLAAVIPVCYKSLLLNDGRPQGHMISERATLSQTVKLILSLIIFELVYHA